MLTDEVTVKEDRVSNDGLLNLIPEEPTGSRQRSGSTGSEEGLIERTADDQKKEFPVNKEAL